MSKSGLAVVFVAACAAVLKPPDPDRRLSLHVTGAVFESSNGCALAAMPDPDARVVRIDVRYPVGAIDDPPGKRGLAHLVEHLLFDMEITRNGEKTSVTAELNRLALYWNAATAEDYTTYEVVALPAALDELVGLEVDRLATGCGGLTPAIFEHERTVVMEELRERQGAAGAALLRALVEQVYPPGHPYRTVDSVETVAALQYKDVCDFLAGPYRRGKAILVASGAVTDAALRAAVEHHLGRLHPRQPAIRVAPPLATPDPGLVRIRGDVDAPTLVATWPLPPAASHDAHLLALAQGWIARRTELFALVFGWGRTAHTQILGGPSAPVLGVSIQLTSAAKADDAVSAISKSVELAERILGETRDTRAWQDMWQRQAEALIARWDDLGERDEMVADMLATGSAGATLIDRVQELVAASPDDTRAVVERWLDPKLARYILVEPAQPTEGTSPHAVEPGAEEHATVVDPALADQPLALPTLHPLQMIRYKLGNGLDVILWPHGTTPLVYGRLVVGAGTALDPKGAEGVAELEGADDVFADHIVYTDRALATRVDELIQTLTTELRFPGTTLPDEVKAYQKGLLRARRAKERLDFARKLFSAVYGAGHPYARAPMTEDSVEHIHTDMLVDWARRYVVPANCTLIITGQFDPALVEKYIAYDAEHVDAGRRVTPIDAPDVDPGASHVDGIAATPSPTVELDVAFRGGGIDRSYAARLVLQQVLAARLEALRAKRALTYGFAAVFEPRVAGGIWLAAGDVDATRAGEAAAALTQVFDDLRGDPEAYRADFVLTRSKVVEALAVASTSSGSVAEQLVMIARFDLPDSFYAESAETAADLTLGQFAVFVKSELPREREVRAAFGNRAAVDAADAVFAATVR